MLQITIPTDDDGYILLKCARCGEYFKIESTDFDNDEILALCCPACGLESERYVTEDVIDLARTMLENYVIDEVFGAFEELERKTNNRFITFKAGKRPRHKVENPIRSGIEAMEITKYPCCKRSAKIKPLLKITGSYCPYCGVKNYETE